MFKKIALFCLLGLMILPIGGVLLAAEDEGETLKIGIKKENKTLDNMMFHPFGGLALGFESNVFQSPAGLEISDSFKILNAGFNLGGGFGNNDRYKLGYELEAEKYSTYTVLDELTNKVNFDYTYEFNKNWETNLGLNFKKKDQNATDIYGVEYSDDYAYTKFSGDTALIYQIYSEKGSFNEKLGKTKFELSYKQNDKNYQTSSLSYTERIVNFEMKQKLGKKLGMSLSFNQNNRNYDEALAQIWGGGDNLAGVTKKYIYRTVTLGFDMKLNKQSDLSFEYGAKHRTDPYEGHYSYAANILELKYDLDITKEIKFTTKCKYEPCTYEDPSAISDGNPPTKNNLNFSIGLSGQMTSNINWFIQGGVDNCNTNVTTGDTDRSYSERIITAGVNAGF